MITSGIVESYVLLSVRIISIALAVSIPEERAAMTATTCVFCDAGRIQVHLASIIPDSTVVEDGTNICRSSHDYSPPRWEKRAAFSAELLRIAEGRTSTNDDQRGGRREKNSLKG